MNKSKGKEIKNLVTRLRKLKGEPESLELSKLHTLSSHAQILISFLMWIILMNNWNFIFLSLWLSKAPLLLGLAFHFSQSGFWLFVPNELIKTNKQTKKTLSADFHSKWNVCLRRILVSWYLPYLKCYPQWLIFFFLFENELKYLFLRKQSLLLMTKGMQCIIDLIFLNLLFNFDVTFEISIFIFATVELSIKLSDWC